MSFAVTCVVFYYECCTLLRCVITWVLHSLALYFTMYFTLPCVLFNDNCCTLARCVLSCVLHSLALCSIMSVSYLAFCSSISVEISCVVFHYECCTLLPRCIYHKCCTLLRCVLPCVLLSPTLCSIMRIALSCMCFIMRVALSFVLFSNKCCTLFRFVP